MLQILSKLIIVGVLSGLMAVPGSVRVWAYTEDAGVKRQPLKVMIRPRSPKKPEKSELIDPEMRERINKNSMDFKWQDILDHRFLSGYQDEEKLKHYGYPVNSDIGQSLLERRLDTEDPDNVRHQTDFTDRQIYQNASLIILDPMKELRQGCLSKNPDACSYSGYGQYWLKFNLRSIESDRSRADDFLVNLLRSLE